MILDLQNFVATERPYWDELELFLKRLEDNPSLQFTLDQTRRFHYLYDRASSDLLRISTFASSPEVVHHLETLVARAYGEIHETRDARPRFDFLAWFLKELPRTFRRRIQAFWLSLAFTLLGVVFSCGILYVYPDAKEALQPFAHLAGKPSERVAREEAEKGQQLEGRKAGFAGYLMTHNIRVSIFTLALGMTYGVGTGLMLFSTGVMIGVTAFDYIQDGQTRFLIGWLLPHGSVEIPSILLAGQAGFMLAAALFGSRERLSLIGRLRAVRNDLVTLIGGFSLLLVWAGIIEAFFSQYHEPVLPYEVKIGFGMVELVLLFSFLTFGGRKPDPVETPT